MDDSSDLTRDLTKEEQVLFGVRYGMSQIGRWSIKSGDGQRNLPDVAARCAKIATHSTAPIVGWTKGIQWVAYGSAANLRMFIGSKRFSFFATPGEGENMIYAIYADEGVFATIALFIEEIERDVWNQIMRIRDARKDITNFVTAMNGLNAESFPAWSAGRTKEAREDALHQLLHDEYEKKYTVAREGFQTVMRNALLRHCRTRGARYVSIHENLFCVLEDVRTDGVAGSPVAHQIAEDLNFFGGSFDSFGVKTMNLSRLIGKDNLGVWAVDHDEPIKVGDKPISESTAASRMILRGQGDLAMEDWLTQCGAHEPKFGYR